ncbi:chordopoxvirus fusion protein [Candidatus Calescamantes bacterium]|nr:chordopoxvirus fusion protein [Candidatus Calescamantes bacterium]
MDISTGLIRKLEKVEPYLREVLISILEEIERQREERVTRKEFQELRDIVKELAEAQRRTEERVNELAEAQRKTEERLNELAEAQRRTEERLNELAEAQRKTEERVNELAEAQRRTEERLTRLEETVEKLAEAQRRTEERLTRLEETVEKLAEAQRRTEEEIARLTGEIITLKKEVGGLAHTVGYRLEDEAMKALPEILKKEMNLRIIGRLRRDFVETRKGKFVEVNIWGEGRVDGKDYIIIGEAKSQLRKRDIDSFIKKAEEIKKFVPGEQIRILVTYIASPPVRKYAEEKGIRLYFSYEF